MDVAGTGFTTDKPVTNEGNTVDWSDLPSDILPCVASRLKLVDQIRFRAICKSWREIEGVKADEKLPWIFAVNENSFKAVNDKVTDPHYYLCDLVRRKFYSVFIQRQNTRTHLRGLAARHILCIKLGWLLVDPGLRAKFLLFNPFTQELIDLPKFSEELNFPLFTFCYCTKSRRLVVYATNEFVHSGVVKIQRWKCGDGAWESSSFEAEFPSFMKKIIKIEIVGEALFCVFETGVVGCFKDRRKSWSVVVKYSEHEELFSGVNTLFQFFSLAFEFRGELFIMDLRDYDECPLWRLDRYKGRWVEVVQFDKCAIFFCQFKVFSFLCSEQFAVSSDPVTTRIYYLTTPYDSIGTEDYNHRFRTLADDPFHITKIKFPWCPGNSPSDSLWIEPCLFLHH